MDARADFAAPLWGYEYRPDTGVRLGGEPRIASYLADRVGAGGVFTMRMLRDALPHGGAESNDDEQLNRRMRKLRQKGWIIHSKKDDRSLKTGQYRVERVGWTPENGPFSAPEGAVSQRARAAVLERDGFRCRLCGRAGGERWEDGAVVTLTIGHITPQSRGGSNAPSNLRAECSRCNEPKRDAGAARDTLRDVEGELSSLPRADKQKLLAWLERGERTRDRVDELYDRVRVMGVDDASEITARLRRAVGG